MTLPLNPGAQIAAELRTGRAGRDRVTSVEFVGGPRCGAIETVAHAGAAARTLHDDYHRTGRRLTRNGALRYQFRRR
jgi:hypothetical protein